MDYNEYGSVPFGEEKGGKIPRAWASEGLPGEGRLEVAFKWEK